MNRWRNSQRLPLRCTECARRRVRCDKKAPCSQCVAKSRAHLCTREVVRIRGKLAVASPIEEDSSDIARENSKLRDRVSELELAFMLSLSHSTETPPSQCSRTFEDHAVHERMGAILADWNLGMVSHRPSSSEHLSHNSITPLNFVQRLPNQSASTYILRYSLETLGWVHCAVRADQFMEEHQAFQESRATRNGTMHADHGWMAVYLSLLVVGLFFMGPTEVMLLDLEDILVSSDTQELCEHWYKCVFSQLELSNAMAMPRLSTVQVAAILTLCNSHFGETFRESNMASVAINTARALNMHWLGTESSYCKEYFDSMAEWKTREDRDLGRRLWWSLTISDWLATTRRRPPSIHPASFNSEISMGHSDRNIILNQPLVTENERLFSPLLHHVALSRLARHVYAYTQTPRKSPAALARFFHELRELEDEFLSEVEGLATVFTCNAGDSQSVPVWLAGQRAHYCCTLNFIRLSVAQVLLQPSLPSLPLIYEIGAQAMEAAMGIVQLGNVPEVYGLIWIFNSAMIAAGVFLCLNVLVSGPGRDSNRSLDRQEAVRICIEVLLRRAHKTKICRYGERVLNWLLELDSARQKGEISSAGIIRAIINTASTTDHNASLMSTVDPPQTVTAFPHVYSRNWENGVCQRAFDEPEIPFEALGSGDWDFDWMLNSIISLAVPS
ncbi:hypothetical protein BJY01DRAFT_242387 [Aspergillus pseudoustus]|uniref:Zn(2)-C6 fungal-type domain-containing protein n=1 Tax=Aspergillus pseudoustus TaxID=1810923 RepID=A0ABR4KYF9_9EURO